METYKSNQNVNPAKKDYKRTGRITDPLHNWNTLPHELKVWQRVCVVCGICFMSLCLTLSLLKIGVLILAGEFF